MQSLSIIKIGGNIINDPETLGQFLCEFGELNDTKILVHGGGNAASDLCERLHIPVQMKQGRRITDEPALDVAVMVYAGLINKKIVAKLQAVHCNALGLSGADLNVIPAKKRNHPEIDFGFVGDISPDAINTNFIRRLLAEDITPVFSAVTHDTNGQLLNTNADTIAASLAIALSKYFDVTLTYCFEKQGVLQNAEDEDSRIDELTQSHFAELKMKGAIHRGMIPKLDAAFKALNQTVDKVYIKHAKNLANETGTELLL